MNDLFPRPAAPPPGGPDPIQSDLPTACVAREVQAEVERAMTLFPGPQHSAHEGYAVLLEEVDELWQHVKTNQAKRDLAAMRKEAVQVAAMAVRFVVEVCDGGRGRV